MGFSFASLILSYFLVGGGMFIGTLAAGKLGTGEIPGYLILAAGAFVGGFFAARASRGSTIVEPALGAIAVVATVVGFAGSTPLGQLLWAGAQTETMKFVGVVGGGCVIGALVGAFISEKLLGEATQSSVPWVLYGAFSTFGAALLAAILASTLFAKGIDADLGKMMLIGIAAGCVLAGIAIGASARTRPLIAAFLGGGLGIAGFSYLLVDTARAEHNNHEMLGVAIMAGGGCVATLIGTLIGWSLFGRRRAG